MSRTHTGAALRLLLACALARGAAPSAASAAAPRRLRLAEWNVLYKALDDPAGRRAVVQTLDAAAAPDGIDFTIVVEASGDTPHGAFPNWTASSASLAPCGAACGALTPLTTVSRHETLALNYNGTRWSPTHVADGAFDVGRPYLLAHFAPADGVGGGVWVVAVHLPHFLDTACSPGQVLADALAAAAAASGEPVEAAVLAGDWNEFQWEDNPVRAPPRAREPQAAHPAWARRAAAGVEARSWLTVTIFTTAARTSHNPPPLPSPPLTSPHLTSPPRGRAQCRAPYYPKDCRERAAARMAPLWDGFFGGGVGGGGGPNPAVDVVPNHTTTCCTKWAAADRHTTPYVEWEVTTSPRRDHIGVTTSACIQPRPA